jgi:hypothetical protein
MQDNRAKRDAAIAARSAIVDHLPSEMTVAATDRCNLRCVMCGTHHRQEGAYAALSRLGLLAAP